MIQVLFQIKIKSSSPSIAAKYCTTITNTHVNLLKHSDININTFRLILNASYLANLKSYIINNIEVILIKWDIIHASFQFFIFVDCRSCNVFNLHGKHIVVNFLHCEIFR